ncbi:MAG: RNA methyltransferase [Flavobacteriaceae bacterium]
MVSKSQIKLITSLRQKKYRSKHQLFFAEGTKVIDELYQAGWKIYSLFSTEKIDGIPERLTTIISENELKKISNLKTPNKALGVFHIQEQTELQPKGITVVLDDLRDPGNLGTIIRLCDWFGVKNLVCSPDTVDCYNPKVIQSTMGSIARVSVHYLDLEKFFENNKNLPVFGAFMEGENVYREKLPEKGILIMGNEANGISSKMERYISQKISIPQFGVSHKTESLNVATATAILLSEFHRSIEM